MLENEARRGRLVEPLSFITPWTFSGDCGASKASWRDGEGRMIVSMIASSTQNGRQSVVEFEDIGGEVENDDVVLRFPSR